MKNKTKVYSLSTVILALLLAMLQTLCLLTAYNGDVGYLDNTPLVLITRILYVIGALWCFAVPFLSPSDLRSPVGSLPYIIFSNLSGTLFLFSGISILIGTFVPNNQIAHSLPFLVPLSGILAAFASSFFFTENRLSQKSRRTHAWCGFLVLVFLFCLLFYNYFDMYVAINSPLKTMLQLSVLSATLYALYEIRATIGRPYSRIYAAARLLCVLFCLPTSISHLIFRASGQLSELTKNVISPFFSLPLLAIGIFAVSKLIFGKKHSID